MILERIAAAAYADWIEPVKSVEPAWSDLPQSHRDRLMSATRAMLLALADAKLSDAAMLSIDAGVRDQDAFRAIVRVIAEEGK